jgi:ATP-dependent DNA helicase DinG
MPIHRVQVDLFKRYEPVKFGQLSFVLADPRSPNPTLNQDDIENDLQWTTNPDWLDYAAKMIMKAGKSGERVLVLTLSYRDTVELAARLEAEGLKDRLLEHKKGVSIDTLSGQFAEANGAIMITPSGWEGLDMQGLVTNLVITRIPFMPPNSADVEILRAHLIAKRNAADKIEGILRSKQTNEARRKMAQGVGRALRSPTDVSTVWIADPRFPMPESMSHALHVAVMEAPKRLVQKKMVECIPRRFRNSAYQQAEVMLLTGERCRLR